MPQPAAKPVKIWNVCPTHDPAFGGLYRGINDFAQALDAPIVSLDDGRKDRSRLADRAVRIPAGTGLLSRDCHLLPKAAADQAAATIAGADLLIVHSLFRAHAPWAAAWARQHGARYWAVPHGCLDPWSLRQRGLVKRIWLAAHGRRYLAEASWAVFSTRRALDHAGAWVRDDAGVVVRWPVDVPGEEGRDAARGAFRERLGVDRETPILLFVGRLHAVKRPLEMVRAFCMAEAVEPHLVIVGMDGDLAAADVLRVVPKSHAERVHAVGGLAGERLTEAYRAADGFISLSFQENFGYAVADALAHGLPVILSPGHDLAYEMPMAGNGRLACGWLLPDDSPATASQAIGEWAAMATGRQANARLLQMGQAGREWAADALSRERFREELRRLL